MSSVPYVSPKAFELFGWMWRASKGLRLQSVLNAFIGILSVVLDFAFIYATKWTIDIATNRAEGSLRVAAYALAAIMLSKILLGFARKWVSALLGVRSLNILQKRLFVHLLKSEWSGQEGRHTGDTLNRMEQDVRDLTVCVTTTAEEQLKRLLTRGHTLEHAKQRIAAQLSNQERETRADIIVRNDGSKEQLKEAADALLRYSMENI